MASFIKFTTYNLHGLNQGQSMLFDLCGSMDVNAVQEHWLLESETVIELVIFIKTSLALLLLL